MYTEFYSLGAAEEVTGSKHVFEIDGKSYLIDCGAFQGSRAEAEKKNRDFGIPVDRVESVILTHGHLDHCGLLPLLTKNGYKGHCQPYNDGFRQHSGEGREIFERTGSKKRSEV